MCNCQPGARCPSLLLSDGRTGTSGPRAWGGLCGCRGAESCPSSRVHGAMDNGRAAAGLGRGSRALLLLLCRCCCSGTRLTRGAGGDVPAQGWQRGGDEAALQRENLGQALEPREPLPLQSAFPHEACGAPAALLLPALCLWHRAGGREPLSAAAALCRTRTSCGSPVSGPLPGRFLTFGQDPPFPASPAQRGHGPGRLQRDLTLPWRLCWASGSTWSSLAGPWPPVAHSLPFLRPQARGELILCKPAAFSPRLGGAARNRQGSAGQR